MNETLYLESTGPASGALTPGAILRALALGAGVFAEEVTSLEPLGARRVAVTITGERARALSTPRLLVPEGGRAGGADGGRALRGVAWTLRRPEDPPEDGALVVWATWTPAEAQAPSPGALARALHDAFGPDVGAEELGVGFVGPGFAQLRLPSRLMVMGLPHELTVPAQGPGEDVLTVRLSTSSARPDDAGQGAP